MNLDHSSSVPLYHQLQEILRGNMTRKVWLPGSQLPSENELCRLYRVTRPTVRQALERLVREGWIWKRRGKGAFVAAPPRPVGLFSITGTSDAFAQLALKVETSVLRIERVRGCPLAGDSHAPGWILLERARRVNRIPTFYEFTWLDAAVVPGLDKLDLNNQSLFKILSEEYGLHVRGGKQQFSAVPAPLKIARTLKIRPGSPMLRVVRAMDLIRQHSGNSGLPGALRVDLYAMQGPFVLEQDIPAVQFGEADFSMSFEERPANSRLQGAST